MEQYCTAMLAIVLALRGEPDDKTHSKSLIDKLEMWPAKNSTVSIVKRISSSFFNLLEEKGRGSTKIKAIEDLVTDSEAGNLVPLEESASKVPYDHLISKADIHNLVAKAKYLMELD
jgi:predicted transcriptional regulator